MYSLALIDDRNSTSKNFKSDNYDELEHTMIVSVIRNVDFTYGEICLSNDTDVAISYAKNRKLFWCGYEGQFSH